MTMPLSRLASRLLLCSFIALGLTACDSSDDEDDGGNPAIVGNWIEDIEDDSDYDDYLLITASGSEFRIGFAEHDRGAECFWVENEGDRIVPLGGNRYRFVDDDRENPDDEEFTMTVSGNTLTISGEDDDEEFTSTWERSSRTNFTPECEDEGDRAPSTRSSVVR